VTISARGIDGTTAASHAVGASVVLVVRTQQLDHLWGATPDTHRLDVPPYVRGAYNTTSASWDFLSTSNALLSVGSGPSGWDEEFEAPWGGQGTPWTVGPAVPSNLLPGGIGGDNGCILDLGQYRRSCLTFRRADFSATSYYLSRAFTAPAGPYMLTAKLHHAARTVSYTRALEASLFISDQTTPSLAAEGTMVRLSSVLSGNAETLTYGPSGGSMNLVVPLQTLVKASYTISSGPGQDVGFANWPGATYLRIVSDGNGSGTHWRYLLGDGLVWQSIATIGPFTFTPRSLGLRFWSAGANTDQQSREEVVVDWLRVEGIRTTGVDANWEL
jgi:hypothetical protein